MAALSLGRKRPRRAYAAGHAAPQQYRSEAADLQVISSSIRPFAAASGIEASAARARHLPARTKEIHREQSFISRPFFGAKKQPLALGIADMRQKQSKCRFLKALA